MEKITYKDVLNTLICNEEKEEFLKIMETYKTTDMSIILAILIKVYYIEHMSVKK